MLTHIEIENFRGIRRLATDIAPVTAFLGPNSSGKTTVLHAIRLACDALRLALDSERPARVETDDGVPWIDVTTGTLLGHESLLPLRDWRALFVDQVVGEGVKSVIHLHFDETDPIQQVWVEIACARNEQLKLSVSVRSADTAAAVRGLARKSSLVNQRLTESLREHAPLAVFVPPFYGTVLDEEYRARAVVDRLLGSGDQSHVVRNLVAGLDTDQLTRLNAFLDETIGARLVYRTTGDALQSESPLRVTFRDSNGDIEVSAAGAGLVNLVALYASLSRWRLETVRRRVLFLLDEPEAHLHPRLQAESTDRLGRLVTQEFGAQLLLATHSVDILNRLSASGALLLRCDRTAEQGVVALDSDSKLFDDVGAWADLSPYTAINFLASRRVAFCEGDDEVALLPLLAELRFLNDPSRLRRFRRWALVRLTGASNEPVAGLLARLLRNDVVRTQAQAGGFEVHVLLDRDYHRQPGSTTVTHNGVTETKTVWSRHSLESLLVEPAVLAAWIRAFAGDATPTDLMDRLGVAIAEADAAEELNTPACDQLAARLFRAGPGHGEGNILRGDQGHVHANRLARERVRAEPAVWQRGHDRARFVLGRVRESISLPARNRFPTDLVQLVRRADVNRIGDPRAAIPTEIGELLDRLVAS